MSKGEAEKYKNDPEGSPGRQYYEFYHLPFADWLVKYYTTPKLDQWEAWLRHARKALSDPAAFLEKWGKFDLDEMQKILQELRAKNDFDDDILIYLSFLAGQGFFKMHKITVDQWCEMLNWENPSKSATPEARMILEIKNFRLV